MSKFVACFFALVAVGFGSSRVSATTYVYDAFSGSPGALQGQAGSPGVGGARNWLQAGPANPPTAINVVSGSLTGPTELKASTGNSVAITGSGGSAGSTNRLALQSSGAAVSTTLYYSFLLRVDSLIGVNNTNGDVFLSLNNTGNSSQTGAPTVLLGQVRTRVDPTVNTQYDLGIFTNRTISGGTDPSWTSGLTVGNTVFVVASFTPGAGNSATMWINPDPNFYGTSSAPTSITCPSCTIVTDTTAGGTQNPASVLLRESNAPTSLTLDELRIASTWAEVTPSNSLFWDLDGATAGAGGTGGTSPSGTWDNATANWSSDSTGTVATGVWSSGVKAVFSAGTTATDAYTVTVSGTQTTSGLTFEDGTPTLTGGIVNMTGAGTLDTSAQTVTATVASVISGSAINKLGAGTVVLTANETYSGSTTVGAGTLQLGDGGTTGTLPTGSAVTTNGTFAVKQSDSVTQGTDFSGAAMAGTGGFTQAGTGTTTLNVANTFSGTTRAVDGALVLTDSLALQNSVLDMNASDIGSVTFDNSLTSITLGGLSGTRNFSANSAVALTLGNGNKTAGPYSGVLSTTGSVTKVGTGAQTLSGINTYSGGTNINAGTLQFGQTVSMPATGNVLVNSTPTVTSTLAVNAGGAGEWTNSTDDTVGGTIASIIKGRGGQGLANQVTWTDNSALGIDTTNAPGGPTDGVLEYNGVIGGFRTATGTTNYVGVTKRGTGTLTLSGNNTYTGPLSVANNGGTLVITAAQATAGQAMTTPTATIGNAGILKTLVTNALPTNTVINFGTTTPTYQIYDTDKATTFDQTVRGFSGGNGKVDAGQGIITINVPTGETYTYGGTLLTDYNISNDNHGKIVKDGPGRQDFTQINPNFSGEFILNQGTVGIGDQQIWGTVANATNRLTINGGKLINAAGGSLSIAVRKVDIAGSFEIDPATASNTQFLGNSGNGTITLKTNNPTITVDAPAGGGIAIFASVLTDDNGTRGFTKAGPGVLNLATGALGTGASGTGLNDYGGETIIQEGTIRLSAAMGSNSVAGYGRLGDPTKPDNRVILAGGTLTYNGSQQDANHGGATTDPRTLPIPNRLRVSADSLITYFSTTANLTDVTDPTGITMNFSNDTVDWTAGTLTFRHEGTSQGITFRPTFSGSGFNYSGPVVIDNGAGTRKTVLQSTNGASTTQTWSGDITGSGTYLRAAGGTSVLGGSNVAVNITNNSDIIFDRATAQAYSGAMTGSGNLTKTGGGVLTLSATSGYTGSTSLNNGITLVNGSLTGTSGVTVASGATLGGTGTINSAVTANGKIAPGASIGTLTVGGLTFNSGSELDVELGAPTTGDLVNITTSGGLVLNSGSVGVANAGGMASGTYPILDYAGTLGGLLSNLGTPTGPAGFTYALQNDATNTLINLIVTQTATPGDYNGDTKVNAADYVTWRKDPATNGGDPAGYVAWRENFSQTAGSGSSLGGAAAVPEPTTVSLVLFVFGSVLAGSRRASRYWRN